MRGPTQCGGAAVDVDVLAGFPQCALRGATTTTVDAMQAALQSRSSIEPG